MRLVKIHPKVRQAGLCAAIWIAASDGEISMSEREKLLRFAFFAKPNFDPFSIMDALQGILISYLTEGSAPLIKHLEPVMKQSQETKAGLVQLFFAFCVEGNSNDLDRFAASIVILRLVGLSDEIIQNSFEQQISSLLSTNVDGAEVRQRFSQVWAIRENLHLREIEERKYATG